MAMRIVSVFLCILFAISSVFATEPFLFSTYTNSYYTYFQRVRTAGQEWNVTEFNNSPIFFHSRTSQITDFAPKMQSTRRYSAEFGTLIITEHFSSILYAGLMLEQKQYAGTYQVERNLVPTASINTVWTNEKSAFFQSYTQIEGTGNHKNSVRVFQKFSYGYPIYQTYKLGPYITAKFENGRASEYGAGVFLSGVKVEKNEIIPSIGVELYGQKVSYVVALYSKRIFTSLIPDFLEHDEDEPVQWYSGPFKVKSRTIKKQPLPKVWIFPGIKKISSTMTRYTMPILVECSEAQMVFNTACKNRTLPSPLRKEGVTK